MRPLLFLAVVFIAPSVLAAFPSHGDVGDRLAALDGSPRIAVVPIGESEGGRALRMAIVADPPVDNPADVGSRAVTLLYTQQHGNEPAGTPAALALLEDLAGALGDDVLGAQVVLVVPMVNPDGAEAGTRENEDGTDTNRDHMNLTSAAARSLHAVVEAWRPVVAVDHHEYGGTGTGLGPVRLYDFDATILWPKHANVDPEVVRLSQDVDRAMRVALEEEGYTVGDYGELTVAGVPVQELAGGPTPNIARNHYGLHHAGSLLVESRVDPEQQDALTEGEARRVAVHRATMEATVRYVAANAEAMRAIRDQSARRALDRGLVFDGGAEAQLPAWGYRVEDEAAAGVLRAHGVAVAQDGAVDLAQPLRHHAGLLLDDESAWAITTAEALDAAPAAPVAAPEANAVPFAGALAALAGVAGAAWVRRR